MKNVNTVVFISLVTVLISFSCSSSGNSPGKQAKDYSPVSKALYDTIARMDSLLFDAFNTRNLDKLKELFSEGLEFYHDLGGVTGYKQNMESFKKTFESDREVRRELAAGTLKVYPIKDYGAVELGIHRFYATEKGEKEKLSSEAKFVMLWERKDAVWKLTRVISYAHDEYLGK